MRKSDIACRCGGEEMMMILPGASLTETHQRAEELRLNLSQMVLNHKNQPLESLTASFGVACFPEHGTNISFLLQSADMAMYQAKINGRNRVQIA